jgi:hypothetical protein
LARQRIQDIKKEAVRLLAFEEKKREFGKILLR